MSKSNYPSKIDSSAELPIVRDNVLEIGSEAINSLRSSIIQIQKTLGINPHGATGETVASRLSQSLDEYGNILPEAISQAGLISGPIIDSDVSTSAGIKESKLNLDIPTSTLQSEISSLNAELQSIISTITAVSATLSAHIVPDAPNRHTAASISVDTISDATSSTAIKDLSATDLQTALEDVFAKHINFSGSISSENSSHLASQIWLDTAAIPTLSANDVQGAIEEIYLNADSGVSEHQDLMHSSSVPRSYVVSGGRGAIILDSAPITYSVHDGSERGISQVILDTPVDPAVYNIQPGYELVISNPADSEGLSTGSYIISSLVYSGSLISSIYVYGSFGVSAGSVATASVYSKKNVPAAKSSLLVSSRESASGSSSYILQVSNPDSVYVISSGINPAAITSLNRYFKIKVSAGSFVTLDAYSASTAIQTIDSIVSRINEQAEESHLEFLAYRHDTDDGSELLIAHNLPNTSDSEYTLTVSADSDDALSALGFLSIKDVEISTPRSTPYYIGGEKFVGLPLKFSAVGLTYTTGGYIIQIPSGSDNFFNLWSFDR